MQLVDHSAVRQKSMAYVETLQQRFTAQFGGAPERFFSAPGRTELGGNHTDHQQGCVLAAAVELDTRAAVSMSGTRAIRLLSEGYPLLEISLDDLTVHADEKNTTAALVRGVAAGFARRGVALGGFDAYVTSSVLPGSGLSSSAAFEVLLGTVMNALFSGGVDAQEQLNGYCVDRAFFEVDAVTKSDELLLQNPAQLELIRAVLRSAGERVAMLSGSDSADRAFVRVAFTSDVDRVIAS